MLTCSCASQSVSVFFTLNIFGTAARLVAIRMLSEYFPDHIETLLGIVHTYKPWILLAAVVITAFTSWNMFELVSKGSDSERSGSKSTQLAGSKAK